MKIRDPDLRNALWEDGIRPGDPSWSLLLELQRRRDAEKLGEDLEPPAGQSAPADPKGKPPPRASRRGERRRAAPGRPDYSMIRRRRRREP